MSGQARNLKVITEARIVTEQIPHGGKLRYLVAGARVFASARSWERGLRVPKSLSAWFLHGLPRTALLKKTPGGEELEMLYRDTPVYRWHAVAELLRAFDRKWYRDDYKGAERAERDELARFHANYEHLIGWGYDLQERALGSALVTVGPVSGPVDQATLTTVLTHATTPRPAPIPTRGEADTGPARLPTSTAAPTDRDLVIAELLQSLPALRDGAEMITVRQAIAEQGLDPTLMPRYPASQETLTALAARLLRERGAERGPLVVSRPDGQTVPRQTSTFRRHDIYEVLKELLTRRQLSLF